MAMVVKVSFNIVLKALVL